jgi:NitT/TauT family transport system substrate-binding protein
MKIVTPDLVSSSYFPALAAEELGFYRAEGVEAHVEIFPGDTTEIMKALKNGAVDAVAASAHITLLAFPEYKGAKQVVALSQGTPWLLVLRADIPAKRGDLQAIKGLRISAAPGPDAALLELLTEAGINPKSDVRLGPISTPADASFGYECAKALEAREIDGFWANALGSEIAVQRGIGKIVMDVRRGDGPPSAKNFTFASLTTTDELISSEFERIAAAVRAIAETQQALRANPGRAAEVARRRFPRDAAEAISRVVVKDVPFYDPVIHEESVVSMNRFARSVGLLTSEAAYDQVVDVRFRDLWGTSKSNRFSGGVDV